MKKIWVILGILTGIWLIPEIFSALFMFLFVGKLPILNISISPSIIFIGSILLLSGLVAHFIVSFLGRFIPEQKNQSRTQTSRHVAPTAQSVHQIFTNRSRRSA